MYKQNGEPAIESITAEWRNMSPTINKSKDFEVQAGVEAELLICPKTSEGGIRNTQHTDRVEILMDPADQVRSLERSDKQDGRFQEKFFQRKY